ncbi:MAG: UvrD-helicase domain-containing protein [Clostridiales bacterium]|nr:UvrD-helicase domain-containing protein [Clostridiales bacterium]
MTETTKVAISSDFLTAFARLPRNVQGRVTEFLNKFRNDPASPGLHYEKLSQGIDKKIYSARIDDTYRAIVVRQQESGVYLLLWVDHHDEAYAWAARKRCEVNPKTGAIQIYDVQTIDEKTVDDAEESVKLSLFIKVSDEELLKLGLPEVQLKYVRGMTEKSEFYAAEGSIPHDAYEYLSWIVEGFEVNEVLEMAAEEMAEAAGDDLGTALDTPSTLKSFVVVEGEDELRRIMAEPLEKWRVFLHPTQRKIVKKNYSGSARVLGSAGTGKTVVAMHRAKQLAASLQDRERILFTTFTANLAADIRENLKKICSTEELRRIEVIHLDAWVSQFLREANFSAQIGYDEEIDPLWEKAVLAANIDLPYDEGFYKEEWNRIVIPQEMLTLEKYVRATRNGRGTRLDRKKRILVWKVFENYHNLMKENQIRDINTAMYECSKLLGTMARRPKYAHIIVDEGQDFSDNAYKLLRALAGEEHENDLFIVGDSHQRIYRNHPTLSKCGINVRGRSSILKINYRTTEEIRTHAFALLNGISFDDLDEGFDPGDKCQSLTHGEKPVIKEFSDAREEFEFIAAEVDRLKGSGVALTDICIVARTKKLVDDYIAQFTKAGVRSYAIKRNKVDDRSFEGLRVATMHRVKGLEFKYVFIAAVNNRIIPLSSAVNKTDAVSEAESLVSEKCLLYVAMTRAQKGVYITSYGRKSEFLK